MYEASHYLCLPNFVSTIRISTIDSSSTYKGRFAHIVPSQFRQINPDLLHSLYD